MGQVYQHKWSIFVKTLQLKTVGQPEPHLVVELERGRKGDAGFTPIVLIHRWILDHYPCLKFTMGSVLIISSMNLETW